MSGKDLVKIAEKAGWVYRNQTGSHYVMEKNGQHISVPLHKELGKGLEHKLLKRIKEVQ